MPKRKSTFVREMQRMERREPWRKKRVKREGKPAKDETSPDEETQPSKEEKS